MKNNIGHSILIATISLSINYILYFISIALSFLPNVIMNIDNDFISLFIIILIYSILIYLFCRIKKFKRGFTFLKQKLANEYTDIIVLNISIIIAIIIQTWKIFLFFNSLIFNICTSIFFFSFS